MRRIIIILTIAFLLVGCSTSPKKEPIELSAQQVVNRLNDENQDSFLLFITNEECYACDEFEKVINEIEDIQPFEVYYMYLNLEEEEGAVIQALKELTVTTGPIEQLPMTYYFYQGGLQEENKKAGYIEKRDMIEWLRNLHILH